TAIFSAVHAVVLQPLPLANPSRLMVVAETYQAAPSDVSAGNYIDAAAGVPVTANYFDVMGVAPLAGRTFTVDEDQPGRDEVVVLSHRLWTRRFGADPSVVGSAIRLSGRRYTVVGVMPQSFDLTSDSEELWTPIAFTPAQKVLHDEHYLTVYGRLRRRSTLRSPRRCRCRAADRLWHRRHLASRARRSARARDRVSLGAHRRPRAS